MRVLVGCEFSGIVRDAFAAAGHDAWSCDLLPTEKPGLHFQQDIFSVLLREKWDLLICHPPCTHLSVSGARWCVDHWIKRKGTMARWHDGTTKRDLREKAVEFAKRLWECDVPLLAMENPISILSTRVCKPTQIIQPWQFGHGETKSTCLWLKSLPKLTPTNIVEGRENRIHRMPPSETRQADRSRTYQGIADAMAAQWGCL